MYDGINRLVELRDAENNIVQQILYNDANAQTSSFDALHSETKFHYDRNLRQTGTTDGEGNISSVTYDARGNVHTKTDGNGNTTLYRYDAENRLTSVLDALGNNTNYTYDRNGNIISQTDGNGNTTTFRYNAANLLAEKMDPAGTGTPGSTERYTYLANGKMAAKTDRNSVITTYIYDIFGRLVSEDAGGEVQGYTYDANGNLLTMTDATGMTLREYDALNRNISKTVPEIGTTNYEYDLPEEEGQYSERTTDPEGNVTLKTYDRMGRLSAVTVGEETTTYSYYRNGRRYRVTYPDGTKETYVYDRNNQITNLINSREDGTTISSYRYTYDGAGNQLTKTEEKGTTVYTYDNLNRISSVTEPDGKETSYTYDGAGNRKTEKVTYTGGTMSSTLYAYDRQNRLSSTLSTGGSETRYSYDGNGNLLNRSVSISKLATIGEGDITDIPNFGLIIRRDNEYGTGTGDLTLYTYDRYNRLLSMKTGNTTASYLYNAQGYRVEKTVNGDTTRYLYEYDKVVLETDGDNNQTAFQVYGSNLIYREVEAEGEAGAEEYYYLYNAHGDVTGLVDAEGNIAATYDYDAFGNILSETGSADNNIKYAGYQHDGESGLYYLNARYYDSTIARFITEDSYRGQRNDPLSLNVYTYCANKPILYTDPSGHFYYIGNEQVSTIDVSNPIKEYLRTQGVDYSAKAVEDLAKSIGMNKYTGSPSEYATLTNYSKYQLGQQEKSNNEKVNNGSEDHAKATPTPDQNKGTSNPEPSNVSGIDDHIPGIVYDETHCNNMAEFKATYGDVMEKYAKELGVDPNALGAVIYAESGGGGYYKDGRLKIRFENHLFINWYDNNDLKQYFYYNPEKKKHSKNHQYRTSLDEPWIKMHESNQYITEYGALEFALEINSDDKNYIEEALGSTSMGLGQILGANYMYCGYSSAEEMFVEFSKSEEAQLDGMINFIINYQNGVCLEALREENYVEFGINYNGSALYGMEDNIKKYKNS